MLSRFGVVDGFCATSPPPFIAVADQVDADGNPKRMGQIKARPMPLAERIDISIFPLLENAQDRNMFFPIPPSVTVMICAVAVPMLIMSACRRAAPRTMQLGPVTRHDVAGRLAVSVSVSVSPAARAHADAVARPRLRAGDPALDRASLAGQPGEWSRSPANKLTRSASKVETRSTVLVSLQSGRDQQLEAGAKSSCALFSHPSELNRRMITR